MWVLGIESSCDETAVALYNASYTPNFYEKIARQYATHAPFGGVVPELASRCHLESVSLLVQDVCKEAGIEIAKIGLIAATAGPGLSGALIVGLSYAKALAVSLDIPFVAVNHIEAHMYAACAEHKVDYPFISLVVSGGHTILSDISSPTKYKVIGRTLDDAAGEAFDKGAKILGLGFPGGIALQNTAHGGNKKAFHFPRAMMMADNFNFSFSGLKTSLLYFHKDHPDANLNDVTASYQEAIIDALVRKTINLSVKLDRKIIVVGGGVIANQPLRKRMIKIAECKGIRVILPSYELCTDNARMIAYRGDCIYKLNGPSSLRADIFTSFKPQNSL